MANRVGVPLRADMFCGGASHISGTVTDGASPADYRVRLFDQVSGMLIKEVWSEAGSFDFTWIANRPAGYYIVCHNHLTNKAAIFSDQTPSAM